jgi:glutaredoxin-like protein DUF836
LSKETGDLLSLNQGSPEVVVLGKPGCHLCEAVETELRSIEAVAPRLRVVDIDSNRSLYDKYQLRIPIVIIGGKAIFEASMMDPEGEWKRILAQLLGW